jgi:hypothetical protein
MLAVNALRSQQRFTILIGDDPDSAAAKRDRVLSFVIAAAFATEALKILTGTSGVAGESLAVRELASRADVPLDVVETVTQLMAGTHRAAAVLNRIRNQLTFHWDPAVIGQSLAGFVDDHPIIWSEGEAPTAGESIYRLAADVLANALVLERADVTPEERDHAGDEALKAALEAITEAMLVVTKYFEYAIAGFLAGRVTPRRRS